MIQLSLVSVSWELSNTSRNSERASLKSYVFFEWLKLSRFWIWQLGAACFSPLVHFVCVDRDLDCSSSKRKPFYLSSSCVTHFTPQSAHRNYLPDTPGIRPVPGHSGRQQQGRYRLVEQEMFSDQLLLLLFRHAFQRIVLSFQVSVKFSQRWIKTFIKSRLFDRFQMKW